MISTMPILQCGFVSNIALSQAQILNFFGDGSDGALDTVGNISLASTLDGSPVIKQYTSVKINLGHTVTTTNRCKGLWIYSQGDVIISGSISMTARGAMATGSSTVNSYLAYVNGVRTTFQVQATGTSGGYGFGRPTRSGSNGIDASANVETGLVKMYTGGGGSGGGPGNVAAGNGSSGSSFSGGTGGGGTFGTSCDAGTGPIYSDPFMHGQPHGGSGGKSAALFSSVAGGGAGNPGGTTGGAACSSAGAPTGTSPSGTGGIIFIIAGGNVKIHNSGSISANGSNGGTYINSGDGGGGSGGGVIMILQSGSYTNNGTVQANGGNGGVGSVGGYAPGGRGGNGTVYQRQINA